MNNPEHVFDDRTPGVEEHEPTASYLTYTVGLGVEARSLSELDWEEHAWLTVLTAQAAVDLPCEPENIRATRVDGEILQGASTRAADSLCAAVRALAALSGRDYAIPDDVKRLYPHVIRHRLVLAATAEIDISRR